MRLVPLLALAFMACGAATAPVPSAIQAFLLFQNLPGAQEPHVFTPDPGRPIQVFRVWFASESERPRESAFGLRNEEEVGWLESGSDADSILADAMYDFDAGDTYVYSKEFYDRLVAAGDWMDWLARGAFQRAMAADLDTPFETLLWMSEGLRTYISTSIAWALLSNPNVHSSEELLGIMATLPGFLGDAYEDVRARAKELLAALNG